MSPGQRKLGFGRRFRLRKRRHFLRTQRRGRRLDATRLFMFMAPHRSSLRRFGFTVSKKVGGAVVRNGVRRRLREIVRLNQSAFPPGRCYVIVARPEAATATFTALHDDLLGIAAAARPQTPERRT